MSHEKFLYILGAGASAQKLPTIVNLPERMRAMARQIASDIAQNVETNPSRIAFMEKIAAEISDLARMGEEFGTVDTYAKYKFATNKVEYERLKFILSVYFSLEQMREKTIDKRYIGWITSLISENKVFPPNVKIISWNYDFQIQLTNELLFQNESLSYSSSATSGVLKHSPPFMEYYPSSGRDFKPSGSEISQISLLQVNGIAGIFHTGTHQEPVFLTRESKTRYDFLDGLMNSTVFLRASAYSVRCSMGLALLQIISNGTIHIKTG